MNPEEIMELKENMEQSLDKLKRAISARNSWNGATKHYKNQAFAERNGIMTAAEIVAEYTASIRNAAENFNKAYDAYEPYMDKSEQSNLFSKVG